MSTSTYNILGDIMFNGTKHNFFCRCRACRYKRKKSILCLFLILLLLVIIIYQAFILMFVTTKINAIILFVELLAFIFLSFHILV